MCGLVSVITKRRYGFNAEERDAFTSLLFVDTLRGEDSTGAFVVDTTGNLRLAKEATQGPVFVQKPEYKALMGKAFSDGWAAVGHNRKATKGSINDKNAHPFVVDNNIVLVHNGTFFGDHKHHADTEVDSEALAHTIHKHGDDVEAALQTVNAAYALIWYDVKNKTLNFIRNDMRPLYWLETKDAWLWASEPSFLLFAATRSNLEIKEGPFLMKQHQLVSYQLQDDKSAKMVVKDLDAKYRPKSPSQETETVDRSSAAWWRGRLANGYAHLFDCDLDGEQEVAPLAKGMQEIGDPPPRRRSLGLVLPSNVNLPVKVEAPKLAWEVVQERVLPELKNERDVKHVTFEEYMDIHAKHKAGERMTVIIDNIFEADDNPRTSNFIMCGRLAAYPSVYAAFSVNEDNFNTLLEKTKNSVFHMDFSRATWSVDDKTDKIEHNKKKGVCLVYGVNPRYSPPMVIEGNVLQ